MAIHSKLAKVKLGTAATPTVVADISTHCDSFEGPRELGEVEVTTFGATREQYIPGYAGGEVSMGGPWTRALDNHMSALFAGFEAGTTTGVNFEYGPEGTDTGDVKNSGELVMTSYSGAKAETGDALRWEATFRANSYTVGAY